MTNLTPYEILDKALASDFGIEVILEDHKSARSVRRKLYAERERLRSNGNTDYDCLSVLIKGHDIFVVPRDRIPKAAGIKSLDCRPIGQEELLQKALNRGINRLKR